MTETRFPEGWDADRVGRLLTNLAEEQQLVEDELMHEREIADSDFSHPLRGAVLHYDRPTDPVAEGDWDVLSSHDSGSDDGHLR